MDVERRPLPASRGTFAHYQALVIDGSPASRSVLTAMLRDFGIGNVVQTSRPQEARRLLEHRHFHVVACEYHFEGQPMTGQDLIDDLRLAQLLPLSTVVVMISSEAAYANVAEAAEAALDAYLVKPHTEAALCERIRQALERKRSLQQIIERVEQGQLEQAVALCHARWAVRGPHWVNAARIGAELCLRLGRVEPAKQLFEAILATRALPWAKLGYARSEYQAGSVHKARRTLESLLSDHPGYADAYDVMGRVLLDQGEPDAALHALRQACVRTPGSFTRLQKFGLLAYYHGDPAEATQALQRAAALGLNSKTFDLQAVVLLGLLQYDARDARGLGHSLRMVTAARVDQPDSARLRRFEAVLKAMQQLMQHQVADAVASIQQLVSEVGNPDFEFEAACNLVSALARLLVRELRPTGSEDWVRALADRFAVSRTTCEFLCRAGPEEAGIGVLIRQRYAGVCDAAEAAVAHTVAGTPARAVVQLLQRAEITLNAKLIDLALHTLQRHRATIADAAELERRVLTLDRTYRSYGTQIQLRHRAAGEAAQTVLAA